MHAFDSPIDITADIGSSWGLYDVSQHFPDNHNPGLVSLYHIGQQLNGVYGFRHPEDTQIADDHAATDWGCHNWAGVDDNGNIEAIADGVDVYLVGGFDKSICQPRWGGYIPAETEGSWWTEDPNATGLIAIDFIRTSLSNGAYRRIGARWNGASYGNQDRTRDTRGAMAWTNDGLIELYTQEADNPEIWVSGYVEPGDHITYHETELNIGTGWVDVDLSGEVSADADAVLIHIYEDYQYESTERQIAVRPTTASGMPVPYDSFQSWHPVKLDADKKISIYTEGDQTVYLTAEFKKAELLTAAGQVEHEINGTIYQIPLYEPDGLDQPCIRMNSSPLAYAVAPRNEATWPELSVQVNGNKYALDDPTGDGATRTAD